MFSILVQQHNKPTRNTPLDNTARDLPQITDPFQPVQGSPDRVSLGRGYDNRKHNTCKMQCDWLLHSNGNATVSMIRLRGANGAKLRFSAQNLSFCWRSTLRHR